MRNSEFGHCPIILGVQVMETDLQRVKEKLFVEQAHSIFYILQDYSSLTLVERRGDWVLEVIVVVREQEMDNY